MKKYLLISFILLASPLLCHSNEVKLLTSIKPLQLIAAAIQQDITTPEVLLPIGASAHHYTLRPTDIKKIQSADIFYWIGPNMEIFLTKPISNRVKPTIAIQQLPHIKLRYFGDNNEHHDNEDSEHKTGELDPHLWLSPDNAKVIAQQMANDLSTLDPNNQTKYQKNLQLFLVNLKATNDAIQHHFAHTPLKPFFVFHETYDYFEAAYGIKHTGVFSINTAIQPSVRRVANMREQLKTAGNSCIFYEPPTQPKLANTLIKDLPISIYMLDGMGADITVNANGYPTLLKTLAQHLLKCQMQ